MKYCVKCGNKLNENVNFCPKCGNSIKKETKEDSKEKLLLILGTILIIVASVAFAFANWNEMSSIFKILFLAIECLLFLSLSIFSKKVDYKMPYKFLWFIGISFIPIIFNLIGMDKLLGEYLSYDGNGMYVYLAISTFICAALYFISHKIVKSNLFLYISYIFIYMMVISILGIFNLIEFKIAIPILSIFNLVICIFHSFIKNENYNKTINRFISLVLILFTILTCIYSTSYYNSITNIIYLSATSISAIISLVLLIFKSKKNILIYIYPIFINLIILFTIGSIFNKYVNIQLFISILIIILINFIINLKDNNIIKNMSFIFMNIFIFFATLIFNVSYLTLSFVNILLLLTYIFIIIISDQKIQKNISKILLPIIIFIIIYGIIEKFITIDISIIYLITSIICFTIYQIVKKINKDNFLKNVFQIYSYIYLIVSSFVMIVSEPGVLFFILNEVVWLYYFIYSRVFDKNKALSIWLLISSIINFIIFSILYSLNIHYSFIFISLITLILDFIEIKNDNKNSIYIYISILATSISALIEMNGILVIGLCLIVLIYSFSYYLVVKKHSVPFIIKFLYTLVGFMLINNVFNYFIDNTLLEDILVLLVYIIILVSMFLLEVDTDRRVLGYSFVILFPYLSIINNSFLEEYNIVLTVLILVFLILIYFERVFKLRVKDRSIFEMIFLSLIHLATLFSILIFNFIFAAFYIFYGLIKKRDSFTIFGCVLLIINLIINLVNIFNDVAITYVLLAIGLIMLGCVFYIEVKKKNKR